MSLLLFFLETCCCFWAGVVWWVPLFKGSSLLPFLPRTRELLSGLYHRHLFPPPPLSFSPQEFMVGLNFASEDEAEKFRTAVESKITYARRASKPQKPSLSFTYPPPSLSPYPPPLSLSLFYLPSPLFLSQLWRGNLLPRTRNLWRRHLPRQITEIHTVWVAIVPKKENQTNQKGRNWPKLILASQLNLGKGKREREREIVYLFIYSSTHTFTTISLLSSLSLSLSLSLCRHLAHVGWDPQTGAFNVR